MNAIFELKTDKSVEEAVAAVKEEMDKINFAVLFELSFEETLQGEGFDFENEFVILEVCSPEQAKTLLERNMKVGYFLPCKIAVYEENGSVYIGTPRLAAQIELIHEEGVTDTTGELESILKGAIEAAV